MSVTGRLVKDAEGKILGRSGTAVVDFSIASNYSKKKGDQWVDEVSYFNCVMFGNRAKAIKQYLTKGQQVALQVSPRQERWEKDGQKRSMVKLYVDDLVLVGSKPSSEGSAAYGTQPGDRGYNEPAKDFEDDVPF
jgi:single-strand DNA-binding protein